jgi:DNA-binding transcriptional MocR family regulator
MARRANSREVDRGRTGPAARLVDELGDWAAGSGPLFRQLARAISSCIERGVLDRGERLPAERALAAAVVVSRGTAVAAYDVLVADGLIERRQGSGTYVLGAGALGLPPGREGSALVHRLVELSAGPSRIIDLSISVLHDASALPAVRIASRDLTDVEPNTGYSPWGLTGLREAVAQHVTSWGLPSTADEIVITTGAQQAISAAAACWLRPGDTVVVEDPTYPGAIAAFGQAGARLRSVPVDRSGVRVDALADALADRPALVYVQPTVHSPTGAVLAEARRRRIAAMVAEARVPLLEDLALADLVWQRAPAPIASHCPEASVAVVGSLSKLFWGGLRIGWVRAPAGLATRFANVKATHDLGTSAVSQVLAERLLANLASPLSTYLDDLRTDLQGRCETLTRALSARLPEWTWDRPAGGLSLWVRLPATNAEAFAQAALRNGVAVATAPALSPSTQHADRVRLSYSGPPDLLEEGVRRLEETWRRWR